MTSAHDHRRLSKGKKVVFSAIMLAFLLGAFELVLRATGAGDHCSVTYTRSWVCDPILYFRIRPDFRIRGKPLNREGFRTHEFGPKRKGVYRILALGDSCTIGVFSDKAVGYVPEPYPQRLERIVAERAGPGKVEVFNAGVGGYNGFQGLLLLRTKLRGLEPDLITVRYGWNDHFMSRAGSRGNAFREPENPISRAVQGVLLRTKIYAFFRRLAIEMEAANRARGKGRKLAMPTRFTPNVSLDQYKKNLRRTVEEGHRQGTEVWLLTSPHAFVIDEFRGRYEQYARDPLARRMLVLNRLSSFKQLAAIHDSYNEATREVGAEMNVPVVDMVEVYRKHAGQRLFSAKDMAHPLQAGHNLEAQALYERLVARGIVSPRPGKR